MKTLLLYSTSGCHLCEEAEMLLQQLAGETALQWQTVDIAEDEQLMERYGIRIPVLRCQDSGAELGWPFGLDELRAFAA